MKTLESIKSQIVKIERMYSLTKDKKEQRAYMNTHAKLKPVLLILSTGISEESLRRQLSNEEQRLSVFKQRIENEIGGLPEGKTFLSYEIRKRLENEYNIKDIESRIEQLRDILN